MAIFLFLTLAGVLAGQGGVLPAPDELKAVPAGGNQVDLSWLAQPGEAYDAWRSPDGAVWEKVYTTAAGAAGYTAGGLFPYVNYYFLVSSAGAVSDPNLDASVLNSTYIAPAFPPDVHAHAFFLDDTNLCANCHRAHTGAGPGAITEDDVTALCLTCHDGTQSKYNVLSGRAAADADGDGLADSDLETPAGPLGTIYGYSAGVEPEAVHTVGAAVYSAPGGNPAGTGEEWEEALGCASCHDPHNTHNYRLLTVSTPDNPAVVTRGFAVTDLVYGREEARYRQGMDDLCAGCHGDYRAPAGAGHTAAAGTYQTDGLFRHPVGVLPSSRGLSTTLPLEGEPGPEGLLFCLSCHRAHGSLASRNAVRPGDQDGLTEVTNYLLRRDDDGACQDCHRK